LFVRAKSLPAWYAKLVNNLVRVGGRVLAGHGLRPSRTALTSLILLLAACAHAPAEDASPPVPAAPAPQPPLDHSSIAAVLAHRGELHLSDDQAQRLEEMDRDLRAKNEAIRAEGSVVHKAPATASAPQQNDPSMTRPTTDPTASGPGNTAGGRGMGRGHHRGAMGSAVQNGKRTDPESRMDQNDTDAYFAAEALLSEGQRPRAREIAEEYREQLYDYREAVRAKRSGGESAAHQ